MNDRLPIRDRTLILRILVPGLEARLRDKMKETEDDHIAQQQSQQQGPSSNYSGNNNSTNSRSPAKAGDSTNASNKDRILDIEGVTCEPTMERNRTLWNFHCDGATYPAKLVNLPCPIELHKTLDHAEYYKCVDIAQMLIVYEDDIALAEAEEKAIVGYPSYYHSGITPPMKRVVERRFSAREHSGQPPPRSAVTDVETELLSLLDKLAKDEKTKRNKVPTLTTANKTLEEVVDEIVDYEPWMDAYGQQPNGVEFDTEDQLCKAHPEVWLSSSAIKELKDEEIEEQRRKQELADKKEAKRKEKEKKAAAAAAAEAERNVQHKKGIPSKKNKNNNISNYANVDIDAVAAAAAAATATGGGFDDINLMDDDNFDINDILFNDFDLEEEIPDT
jgi:transcription initiation factor TFIID subunit 7